MVAVMVAAEDAESQKRLITSRNVAFLFETGNSLNCAHPSGSNPRK